MRARAAQALFEHGAGQRATSPARARSDGTGSSPCRERSRPGAPAHRHPVARLLARRRGDPVHRRRTARGDDDDAARAATAPAPVRRVEHRQRRRARRAASKRRSSARRPRARAAFDPEHLVAQPAHDLDPGVVARCTVRSKLWPANGFWSRSAVARCGRRGSRSASRARGYRRGVVHERPRELLVVEELAALERVARSGRRASRPGRARRCSRPGPCACSPSGRPRPSRRA